jgi:hypothetical protein
VTGRRIAAVVAALSLVGLAFLVRTLLAGGDGGADGPGTPDAPSAPLAIGCLAADGVDACTSSIGLGIIDGNVPDDVDAVVAPAPFVDALDGWTTTPLATMPLVITVPVNASACDVACFTDGVTKAGLPDPATSIVGALALPAIAPTIDPADPAVASTFRAVDRSSNARPGRDPIATMLVQRGSYDAAVGFATAAASAGPTTPIATVTMMLATRPDRVASPATIEDLRTALVTQGWTAATEPAADTPQLGTVIAMRRLWSEVAR